MNDECLICGAPLEYLPSSREMVCEICRKPYSSNARCTRGHFVCDVCHTKGLDEVVSICRSETSRNPVEVLNRMMSRPFCHMHGPEHHVLVAASLLTAYRNSGGKVDFDACLNEIIARGRNVPGGICGNWGCCGAAVSTGIFVSVISGSSPLAEEPFSLCNTMTSRSLCEIGKVGGPRCCKRDSYLAIQQAVAFAKEKFGVEMELGDIACTFYPRNNQCIGDRCPFHPRASA